MRIAYLVGALASASLLGAQAPATPPVTPAPAPAAAVPKGPSKAEFRVAGFMINGDRSFNFNNSVWTETGSIQGIEVLLRGSGIGLMVRSMTGTYGQQPHVTSADAKLLLFPRVFSVFVGAGRRALWSELNAESPTQYDLGMAGVSSTATIGGTGLRTNLTGTYYIPGGKTADKIKGGMEGEASIMYAPPKVPLFLQIGYRTEIFTSKTTTTETPEEVRGLRVGGGLQIGGR